MSAYGYLVFQDTTLPLENSVILIGRAPSCHVRMTHPSISKEHAIIEFSEIEGAILKDLNSLNGIYVQNTRMPKGSQALLQNGMTIIFGKDPTQYSFFFASSQQREKKPTQSNPRSPLHRDPKDIPVSLVDPQAIIEEKASRHRDNSLNNNRNLATFAKMEDDPKLPELVKQNTANFNQSLSNSDQFKNSGGKLLPQVQTQLIERSDKLAIQSELLELNERVLEREETLLKKENEIKLFRGEMDSLREEAERAKSKLKAIELYATELQRKNDILSRELVEKNNQIKEMESTDWTKKAQLTGSELNHLRQILLAKDEEINSLKKQIQAILQRHTDGGANASHYQNFLEQQAKELANAKKHLQEYENRNEECKRKWNQLIKENINKEEKVKGLTLQLNRQIETYQSLYSETDAKIANLHTKFAQLVSQDDESRERDAAEFLVSQMRQIQEERERYASENEQLHLQTQELIEEIKRLNSELQEYQKYFDKNEMNGILEGKPVNVGKMKSRIEELEDLIYEVKQKEGARKTVELSDILVDLERKYTHQVKLTEDLKNKLMEFNSGVPTQDQNAIEFFSKLLDDKDQKISYLQRQVDVLTSKEKQYLIENEKLKENLKQLSIQYENFKSRQTKLEDAISNRITGVNYGQKEQSSGYDPIAAYVSRNVDPSNMSDGHSHNLYSEDDKYGKFRGGNAIDKFLAFDNAK